MGSWTRCGKSGSRPADSAPTERAENYQQALPPGGPRQFKMGSPLREATSGTRSPCRSSAPESDATRLPSPRPVLADQGGDFRWGDATCRVHLAEWVRSAAAS
jgi:hypothetical protein